MIPSLQPPRPKTQSQSPPPNPFNHQQTRTTHSSAPNPAPSTQIEAMPPSPTPRIGQPAPSPMYNPAVTHPVFFSEAWRRPPFPIPFNHGFSPAAAGYVFGDARKKSGSGSKL